VIAYWAARRPDGVALYLPGPRRSSVSWAEFESLIRGGAVDLGHDLRRGDVVAVLCDESLEFHALVNALWRCGVAVLLVNRTWGSELVNDLVDLVDCSLLFVPPGFSQTTRRVQVRAFPKLRPSSARAEEPEAPGNSIAIYAATSGTTDDPRCVAVTHSKIRYAYRSCLSVHDFSEVRLAASLFPLNGLGILGMCFLFPREVGAGTRVFPPFSMANIADTWEAVTHGDVDFVYLVPPLVRLLNTLPPSTEADPRLRAFCASAPVTRDELQTLELRYPVVAYNVYGLTEVTFAVFFGCRGDNGRATDSIGFPHRIDARIVDETGLPLTGPARGEIHLRGPMLTDGYVKNETATAETFVDGWLHTGDLAERDAEGRYYISGRKKEVVIRGGVLFYLHELEHYLRRAPDVIEACAFVGRQLPSGDELCAVVQTADDVESRVLMEWLRESVGAEKVPNILVATTDELPRNSNGKVLRRVVAERYRSSHGGYFSAAGFQ
jgi:acyl-CoA synthetase (AMP-forming)/AMP-acid ligase II